MQLVLNPFDQNIIKAFTKIMNDRSYCIKGLRCYRVFFYIYLFGCIDVNDLALIYHDDAGMTGKNQSEVKNMCRAFLNSLAKNEYVCLLSTGFYTMTLKGLKELYEHLTENGLLTDPDPDEFKKRYKKRSTHLSHSSKAGRCVLSYVHLYGSSFIMEPVFNSEGRLCDLRSGDISSKVLLPDSLIFSGNDNEKYYIEADSSEERLRSAIIPKLRNYSSYILANNLGESLSTIHISIWNKNFKEVYYPSIVNDFRDILSFHHLMTVEMNHELKFSETVSFLLNYKGFYEPAVDHSKVLKHYSILGADSPEELLKKMYSGFNRFVFTKSFLKRRSSIIQCVNHAEGLWTHLLNGTRMVCLPFGTYNHLYKYIYLEHGNHKRIIEDFIIPKYGNLKFLSYEKLYTFFDETSGDSMKFRNVFLCEKNGEKLYFVFENISDDYGGQLRVSHLVHSAHRSSMGNLFIHCLYNEYVDKEPNLLISKRVVNFHQTEFVSYEDFSSIVE